MSRHSPTPRRGIPKLILDVRRRAKLLKASPMEISNDIGLDYNAIRRLLGKTPQTNLKTHTEVNLRQWLVSTEVAAAEANEAAATEQGGTEEEQLELPLDLGVSASPAQRLLASVMEVVCTILPLGHDKRAYVSGQLEERINCGVEDAIQSQCEASSIMILKLHETQRKLEEEVADKDRQIIAFQNAGTAQFQLGKDVAQMSDMERGSLQALLTKTEAQNVHLRAALQSLSLVL